MDEAGEPDAGQQQDPPEQQPEAERALPADAPAAEEVTSDQSENAADAAEELQVAEAGSAAAAQHPPAAAECQPQAPASDAHAEPAAAPCDSTGAVRPAPTATAEDAEDNAADDTQLAGQEGQQRQEEDAEPAAASAPQLQDVVQEQGVQDEDWHVQAQQQGQVQVQVQAQQHARQPAQRASCKHATGSMAGALGKGLTFSGPPHVAKAKPYRRDDYSHSAVQLKQIERDNHLLYTHLTTIASAPPAWCKGLGQSAACNVASSAVNRRKAAGAIAQANAALCQRLMAIRPSKDISRATLEAEHKQNEQYRNRCSQAPKCGRRTPSPSRASTRPCAAQQQ